VIAVVIPSHTKSLKYNEIVSLKQVRKVLGNFDIYFLLPDSLEIDYGCSDIVEKRYPDENFASTREYNKFMLNPSFYQDFCFYEYILVYQLDAFVFKDNLKEFCDLGYDYIGAPWIEGVYFRKSSKESMWYVGNGGLSLRKVSSFIKWTESIRYNSYINYINEDLLIAAYGSPILDIAPMDVAASFSIETEFDRCMQLTKGHLPFGCHAWERYTFYLWKKLIEEQGYTVETPDKHVLEAIDFTKAMNAFCNKLYSKDEMEHLMPVTYYNNIEGVYIWGTGLWGISLMYKLEESGIKIAGFIDNDMSRCGKRIQSYKIMSFKELDNFKKTIIVAIKNKVNQVEQQLQGFGYKKSENYTTVQYMIDEIKVL